VRRKYKAHRIRISLRPVDVGRTSFISQLFGCLITYYIGNLAIEPVSHGYRIAAATCSVSAGLRSSNHASKSDLC